MGMYIFKQSWILALFLSIGSAFGQHSAGFYTSTGGVTRFMSDAPLENIRAENKKGQAVFNVNSNELAIRMNMKDFEFPNKLMQEHFNENYMESNKYPLASFVGKVDQVVDFDKEGVTQVSATGKFTVHGVAQTRTLTGLLTVKSGQLVFSSDFEVKLVDHKIEVPKIVFMKIAEVIAVEANFVLTPSKK